jgi:hypothetical protein
MPCLIGEIYGHALEVGRRTNLTVLASTVGLDTLALYHGQGHGQGLGQYRFLVWSASQGIAQTICK